MRRLDAVSSDVAVEMANKCRHDTFLRRLLVSSLLSFYLPRGSCFSRHETCVNYCELGTDLKEMSKPILWEACGTSTVVLGSRIDEVKTTYPLELCISGRHATA